MYNNALLKARRVEDDFPSTIVNICIFTSILFYVLVLWDHGFHCGNLKLYRVTDEA